MKLGITNTEYTRPYGISEGYKKMKRHGYDHSDYQHFINTETEFFKSDISSFERALSEETKIAQSEGILFCQAHGPWRHPPIDLLESDRAKRIDEMKKSIYGTAVLNCKNWVVHPFMPFGSNSDEQPQKMIEINLEALSALCDYAKTVNVNVCIENMPFPKLPLATVEALIGFMDTVNRENFKFCLDTGHSIVCKEDVAESIRKLGADRLVALHIHDNDGTKDTHHIPFSGIIDWESVNTALNEISYGGVFSLECAPLRAKDAPDTWEKAEIDLANIAKKIIRV